MKIKLDTGAYIPERAHMTDGGYDLRSCETKTVKAGRSATFDTGVHVELPKDTAGLLVSKSGLNVVHDITSTGLIDSGYRGAIAVKLQNHSTVDYVVHKGDKISQLVIIPVQTPEIEIVPFLDDTDRGAAGFGSTGR